MTYVFDIDGTICHTEGSDYEHSIPMQDRINYINKLYETNTIFFLTARGMGRTDNSQFDAIDQMYDLTQRQLTKWGVKYHRLFLGKPAGDVYIDDKGMKDEDFFTNETC
jgi:hypothetical protein